MWHRLELKYLLFAYVLFRAQWASHQLHKSENWLKWELVVKDRFSRVSYWQLVKNTVSDDFQDRMLKNLNQNPKLTKPIQVSTWFPGIAFHLRLFLVVICLNICQRVFPKFCTPSNGLLFRWNLSRLPLLAQVLNLDLPLCSGFYCERVVVPVPYYSKTNLAMNYKKAEQSNVHCLGMKHDLVKYSEISLSHKETIVVTA